MLKKEGNDGNSFYQYGLSSFRIAEDKRFIMVPIQFITHTADGISYEESALLALKGGCRWIQLRMKGFSETEIEPVAVRVKEACRRYDAVFIIDDHVGLTKKIGADGVHLGRNDMPVNEARRVLGGEYLIGGTANTLEDVIRLKNETADYIGCGPYRFTTTKQNLAPVLGLEGYRSIIAGMKEKGIDLPVCAIGGITLNDIPDIMATGVRGIAVSGAVLRSPDPVMAMRDFIHRL